MSLTSRTAGSVARSTRTLRAPLRSNAPRARLASTVPEHEAKAAKSGASAGFVGGLTGGFLVFAAGYGYYHFSGAKTFVNTAHATKREFERITKTAKEKAPEPNEALKWLRATTQSYASFIPGARSYVDAAFNDLDKVQQKHGDKVDQIVKQAYEELKDVTNNGMNFDTAQKSWAVLEKALSQLGDLAKDSASEILDNHPQIKEKVGGNLEQLKQMANSYGPEAKKELEGTYVQIKEVVGGGVGVGTVSKIKQIVEEKLDKMRKLGDEAWKKGLEQAKPYLEKNPKVKQILEQNAEALKQGNFSELFQKVKESADSGTTESLEKYVKEASEKVKGSGGGTDIQSLAKLVPGAEKIMPSLEKLQDLAKTHGDDAEKILKGAYEDVQQVLRKRVQEAEDLAEKAKKDGKKRSLF